ncbi:MAG: hypothetical protein H6876_07845 [Hyphomicrobiaceae bacterium]|nr:hypothetical protein [Hyphomicrobiaceae bacterium]
MKRLFVTATVVGACFVAAVLALPTIVVAERTGDEAEQAKLAEAGLKIVQEKCARCHAIGMDDKSPHEKAPPFRDVVTAPPQRDLPRRCRKASSQAILTCRCSYSSPQRSRIIAHLDSLAPSGK